MRQILPLALLGLPLMAQGVFLKENKPGDAICSRIFREEIQLNHGTTRAGASPQMVWYSQKGERFFAREERKDVSSFAALNEAGKAVSIKDLKGKVVLVGFWSTKCEPSVKMLLEFADLYAKREKFNFEILAVNFDENVPDESIVGGWRAINSWKMKNKTFMEQSGLPLYIPGIGAQGPSNFVDMLFSVPMLCVVDREGKLASMTIGYEPNFVVASLKRVLPERPVAAPAKPAGAN
ncbi:MAG TPA: TlpA disulfide reductase family protein [Holophagaceae bacterium]|nr:TlpA disulfide reductase family protein [Holophagaceae bacterium]